MRYKIINSICRIAIVMMCLFACSCSPPHADFAIANVSEEAIRIEYKVVLCTPSIEELTPKILSYDDFIKGDSWEKELPHDYYNFSYNENAEQYGIDNNSSCGIEHSRIYLPPKTLIKIAHSESSEIDTIKYLRIESSYGAATFDATSSLLKDCFKQFDDGFMISRETQNVLWYR